MFFYYWPVEGRRHDLFMLHFLGVDKALQNGLVAGGVKLYVFRDSAYISNIRPWLLSVFPTVFGTSFIRAFNRSNNRLRISVEWNYKDLKQILISTDFERSLRVQNSPEGRLYLVECLLWNIKVFLYSVWQVWSSFDCEYPWIEQYMTRF